MKTQWKIFNVINAICLVLTASFFLWPFIMFYHPARSLREIFYLIILIVIMLVTICNCLHNIFLTRILAAGRKLVLIRRVFFWILWVLFTGLILLFIYQAYSELHYRYGYSGAYKPIFRLKYFIQALSISATGLYILIMQVVLFYKIKSSYEHELNHFIDEIGS